MPESVPLRELYYITHVDNVASILDKGVMSHERMQMENIHYTPIYDERIVISRSQRLTPDGKNLWAYANLYFQARNPMLYRVVCEKTSDNIAVLAVDSGVIDTQGAYFSNGNAASGLSEIHPADQLRKYARQIDRNVDKVWWNENDGSKRTIMAEFLIPDKIPRNFIRGVYVASHQVLDRLSRTLRGSNIQIIPEPGLFFQPFRKDDLTQNLSIVEGDLFFSRLQTLTVSVNCVGIMGKGLASRAKYQFPDVYVRYQDLCRKRVLQMGKPSLYKRETSFDSELADEPSSLTNCNHETWFLLFATKQHWRDMADIEGIEEGLQWLSANYKESGIKSLAIPALGCGLGRLEWKDVGPLMCRYLSKLDIPVWIYLPAEKEISPEFVSKEYLLGSQQDRGQMFPNA